MQVAIIAGYCWSKTEWKCLSRLFGWMNYVGYPLELASGLNLSLLFQWLILHKCFLKGNIIYLRYSRQVIDQNRFVWLLVNKGYLICMLILFLTAASSIFTIELSQPKKNNTTMNNSQRARAANISVHPGSSNPFGTLPLAVFSRILAFTFGDDLCFPDTPNLVLALQNTLKESSLAHLFEYYTENVQKSRLDCKTLDLFPVLSPSETRAEGEVKSNDDSKNKSQSQYTVNFGGMHLTLPNVSYLLIDFR